MWRRYYRQWYFTVLATLRSSHLSVDLLVNKKQPLISRVYGWIIDLKRRRELRNIQRIAPPQIPVLSVGNVTFGGTGKTPFVQFLIGYALKKAHGGQVPMLLSRGYGDDEWRILAKQFPVCQLALGADRIRIGTAKVDEMIARKRALLSCVVVDDGLQQWKLAKDLEIIMVDALYPFGNGLLIPCGSLRELPCEAIKRADIVIVHHANLVNSLDLQLLVRTLTTLVDPQRDCVIATSQMQIMEFQSAKELLSSKSNNFNHKHMFKFPFKDCLAMVICGVGNPDSVTKMVEKVARWTRVEMKAFPDHHAFTSRDVRDILQWVSELNRQCREDVVVVTTEKDFARSPEAMKFIAAKVELRVLRCELKLLHNREQVKQRLDRLFDT
ncbi:tetraacyldisaccharide 4-kinase [Plasmopara halstedii]|uniref:tetraacyldisaccharide 4'-kinase n=1 Tax=Plasmopara halstedii TaxID=4781 RepID=A0A0P1AVC8_PLAHL|nr:tetraacyldisaccharide 4-kinase [Plasmopara halstedii]CEG44431.1 tetraacyldisaccharide 4-kinase [Plasmopara halstedii]|eukprot:XP_024580800.1 tetraacyldisaccharide 4-kinase [Plasmopara halstedii]